MKKLLLLLGCAVALWGQSNVARDGCADAGSTDDYACNYTVAPGWVTNHLYWFSANTANTGAATFNPNSAGAKTLKKWSSGTLVDLSTGDISATQWVACIYDGTVCQVISLGSGSGGSGITQLTGDVTAGPGSGSVAATVVNLPTATTQAGYLAATAIAAPATPAAGLGRIYVDSTSKNLSVKDDAGVVKHGVRTDTGTANQYISAIADDGSITKSQPACSGVTNCPAAATAGSAGIAAFNNGTNTTYARSDHTHRFIKSLQWYFPGVPTSGVQNATLMLPAGITNAVILNVQAVANTPQSGGTTTINVQRCTSGCTGTTPTFSNIYATGLGLGTNVRISDCVGAGTCGSLTSTAAASDQYKVNLSSIGTALADVTVQLIVSYENTN